MPLAKVVSEIDETFATARTDRRIRRRSTGTGAPAATGPVGADRQVVGATPTSRRSGRRPAVPRSESAATETPPTVAERDKERTTSPAQSAFAPSVTGGGVSRCVHQHSQDRQTSQIWLCVFSNFLVPTASISPLASREILVNLRRSVSISAAAFSMRRKMDRPPVSSAMISPRPDGITPVSAQRASTRRMSVNIRNTSIWTARSVSGSANPLIAAAKPSLVLPPGGEILILPGSGMQPKVHHRSDLVVTEFHTHIHFGGPSQDLVHLFPNRRQRPQYA